MAVPAAPTIHARHQGGSVVRVVIDPVAGALGYKLYRDDYPTAPATLIASGLSAGINYDVPSDMARYNYAAKATNADGDSVMGATVTVKVRDVSFGGSPTRAQRINRAL